MSKAILNITIFCCFLSSLGAQEKPNIIVILLDDMGIMDSSTYGSDYYETPNLTRLANAGVKFTKAYAASPLCTPTRSSILTGQFPARTRMTAVTNNKSADDPQPTPVESSWAVGDIEPRSHIPVDITTLAQVLKNNEYHTAHIGKWHLYHEDVGVGVIEDHQPEGHGFDYVIGGRTLPGPKGGYYSPYNDNFNNLTDGPEGENLTERLSQEAIDWMEGLPEDGKPFFLNLWQYAVHGPIITYEQADQKYKDSRDPTANQRCPEMATMLASMDSSVGILLDWLDLPENAALKHNTLIILTSDNGGVTHNETDQGDTYTANRPFRGGKANTYEGGMRVPWIMSWSGNSNINVGTESDVAVTTLDIFPTILDAAKISEPNNQVLDGRSILPTLEGNTMSESLIYTDFPNRMGILCAPSVAVRDGDWKLIRYYWAATSGGVPTHYYELFNLAKDPVEAINLTDYYPEKVTELDAAITQHLTDTDALIPLSNSEYSGAVPFSRGDSSDLTPVTLTLENQQICVSENGQEELQLLDQEGAKRYTHALVLEGEDFVTVTNTADGKSVISWDVSSSESTAKVLLGWSGGATTRDVNNWTLAPVLVTVTKNGEGCGEDSNLIPLGDFEHMLSNESFNTDEEDNNWRASSTGAVDWKGQSGGNPGEAASLNQHKASYYLASNKISFEDGKDYSMFFDLKQDVGGENVDFYVGLSSTQDRANIGQNLFQTSSFSNSYSNEKIHFQVAGGGEYYVVFYTNNAANKTVVNLYVDNVRVEKTSSLSVENIIGNEVLFYPNPVGDKLFVETINVKSFQLIDSSGRHIETQNLSNGMIDFTGIEKGVYFIRFVMENGTSSFEKIIKE